MASLEDRILDPEGCRQDNYCSSSEDEGEEGGKQASATFHPDKAGSSSAAKRVGSYNTGPKGVMEDWRRFQQLQTEKKVEDQKELSSLAQRISMTCRTAKDDERARLEEEEEEKMMRELEEDGDDVVREYMMKRMQEMMGAARAKNQAFGELFELSTADEFLNCVENDSKSATVVLHIYEKDVEGCDAMNGCLACLAKEYPMVKFCRVRASVLGTSKKFRVEALPTVQAYREGDLINSFVRLTDDLGSDFFAEDVESFLRDYGVLPDPTQFHSAAKEVGKTFGGGGAEDEDSDFSID